MLAVICAAEPMTRATAMVSPMARPRPSITAPTRPPLEWGSTAPRIISQRVAPRARAASRSPGGVVSMTSRESEVMIGMIMMARMRPAVMKERPLTCDVLKIVLSTGMGSTTSAIES